MQPTQRNTDVIAQQQPDSVPPVLAQESQLPSKANVMSAVSAASAALTGDKTTKRGGVLDKAFGEVDVPAFFTGNC